MSGRWATPLANPWAATWFEPTWVGLDDLVRLVLRQSVYAAVVYAVVVVIATAIGRRASPRLCLVLFSLPLVRLVLPVDLATPWSLRSLLRPNGPAPTASGPTWTDHGHSLVTAASATVDGRGPIALALLWILGFALVSWWLHRRAATYRTIVRNATVTTDPALVERIESWRQTLAIRRRVQLSITEAPVSPFTVGVLRPRIVLPSALLRLAPATTLEAVIGHEMAHVARLDALWLGCTAILKRLYFFHPAVWLSSYRIDVERERAADQLALAHCSIAPSEYARSIVAVLRLGLVATTANAFANAHRRTLMRIVGLLSCSSSRRRPGAAWPWTVAAALFVLPMATYRAAADPSSSVAATSPMVASIPAAFTDVVAGARLTSGYGDRVNPFSNQTEFHRGIDLAAPTDTVVLAPAASLVELATTTYPPAPRFGVVVILDHGDGVKTFYAHLGRLAVATGDHLAAGAPLGYIGSSGTSTGPHVHIEVWQAGEPVDPAVLTGD